MIKDSIIWFVFSGGIVLFNSSTKSEDVNFFWKMVKNTISLMIIFEFIVNSYNFPLIGELIFIPFVTFIVVMKEIASMDKEHRLVEKVMEKIEGIIGLIIISLSIYYLPEKWSDLSSSNSLKGFVFPILMTILFIPFAYIIALYVVYEKILMRISFNNQSSFIQDIKIRVFLFLHMNINLSKAQDFHSKYALQLFRIENASDLKKLISPN